jgi:signal transduction histidine kinase
MASRVWVTVDFSLDRTVFTIKDNGRGFHPPERIGDLAVSGKLGLTGMQERAQLVGARLSIKSVPGEGTTVAVEVPNPTEPQEHAY